MRKPRERCQRNVEISPGIYRRLLGPDLVDLLCPQGGPYVRLGMINTDRQERAVISGLNTFGPGLRKINLIRHYMESLKYVKAT